MKAVVLHSGGLDSTTAISQAIEDGAEEILALSVHYGSLHNDAEGESAKDVIQEYSDVRHGAVVTRLAVVMPKEIFQSERSALMGEIEMPNMTYQEIQQSEGPSPTVVPFRNANLLSIATAIADARGYDFVYIGAHADDAHQWAYPDCTPEFLGAMANAIYIGTYEKVRLVFPFIWMQKWEIVTRGVELGAPLHLTWSCYNPKALGVEKGPTGGVTEWIHCGKCPTCIERANAFAEAGFIDPTAYYIPLTDVLGEGYDLEELVEWPIP